jgi:hypothetical protein
MRTGEVRADGRRLEADEEDGVLVPCPQLFKRLVPLIAKDSVSGSRLQMDRAHIDIDP